jgi:hypothetical protein
MSSVASIDLRQIDPDKLYTRPDAGDLTRRAPKTLANMASERRGPAIRTSATRRTATAAKGRSFGRLRQSVPPAGATRGA